MRWYFCHLAFRYFLWSRERKRDVPFVLINKTTPLIIFFFFFFPSSFFFFFFNSLYHLIFFITIQIKNQLQNKIFLNHINHILLLLKEMFTKPGLTFGVFGTTDKYNSQWIMHISLFTRIPKKIYKKTLPSHFRKKM